ncbi:MAG: UbiA family prenyltransferase [Chloroflexota bacterium]
MFKLSRPLHLLFLALAYALGVAITDYLGIPFSASAFALGLVCIGLAHVGMNLLAEVFRPANEPILPGQFGAERVYLRDRLLIIAIGLLAIAAGFAYLLYLSDQLEFDALILLALSLFIVFAYAVPPLRLARRGFGELLLAAHIGYVAPSLGFVLQAGDFHRLLPIFALPVTTLALAYFLVLDFPSFADDIKYERLTLLTRLGWQRVVPLHHGLVLLAYAFLAAAPLLGVSLALIWPAFLALPFAVMQIIMLRNIALGARPLWRPLASLAAAFFALTVYLLAFAFFLR